MSTAKFNNWTNTSGVKIQSVLQVVQATKTDTFSSTAGQGSPVDITGLSATITPLYDTSKVLAIVSIGGVSANQSTTHGFILVRGSTSLNVGNAAGSRARVTAQTGLAYSTNTYQGFAVSFSYLDSPATTSPTTYKVQGGGNGVQTWYINQTGRDTNGVNEDSRAASSIILMEIAT